VPWLSRLLDSFEDLRDRAGRSILVGPSPHKLLPMSEPVPGDVVVLYLGNQHRLEWMPLTNTMPELCHNLAWYAPCESRWLNDLANHACYSLTLDRFERSGTNEVQQLVFVQPR